HFRSRPVGPIKQHRKVLVVLRAITGNAGANGIEDLYWQTFGVGGSLQHDWGNSSDQNCRCDPLATVTANVARYFAASGRMSDECGVFEIQRLDYRREVICVSVHVISCGRLTGSPMPAPVNGDTAIPVLGEKQHLTVPGIGVQRPTMRERYGWSFSPVFVVNCGAILSGNGAHRYLLYDIYSLRPRIEDQKHRIETIGLWYRPIPFWLFGRRQEFGAVCLHA